MLIQTSKAASWQGHAMGATPSVHACTPTLVASDPRGMEIRMVRYLRSRPEDPALAQIERIMRDAAGRIRATWDARAPLATPNTTLRPDLSGRVLHNHSVDAGDLVLLFGDVGQTLRQWDSRGTEVRRAYDAQARPTAIWERRKDEPAERCVERLAYVGNDPGEADAQRCGRLAVHYDAAGRWEAVRYGLLGKITLEHRRFRVSVEDDADWLEPSAANEASLEPDVYASGYTYDAVGAPRTLTDAAGHTRRWQHNVAGKLSAATLVWANSSSHAIAHDIVYNAQGDEVRRQTGSSITEAREYDPAAGRLLRHIVRRDDRVLQDRHFESDPVGNVVRIADMSDGPQRSRMPRVEDVSTYRYDSLYRLIEARGRELAGTPFGPGLPAPQVPPDPNALEAYAQTYDYDAGGNLLELRHHGEGGRQYTRRYAVAQGSNRALPEREDGTLPDEEAIAGAFDANGNLRILAPGQPLHWDGRNQLHRVNQISRAEGVDDREVYVYDLGGMRVRKRRIWQAQAITHMAEVRYLPGLERRTHTARGEVLDVVIAGDTRGLHWHEGRPDEIDNDQLRHATGDHLRSTTLELDDQGALISRETYYPYGGTAWWAGRNQVEAEYKTARYSGHERDATGLVYYGFRYYAPWYQRWINPDPAGPVNGLNLYQMVEGNPTTHADWKGLSKWTKRIRGLLQRVRSVFQSRSAAGGAKTAKNMATPSPKALVKSIEELEKQVSAIPGVDVKRMRESMHDALQAERGTLPQPEVVSAYYENLLKKTLRTQVQLEKILKDYPHYDGPDPSPLNSPGRRASAVVIGASNTLREGQQRGAVTAEFKQLIDEYSILPNEPMTIQMLETLHSHIYKGESREMRAPSVSALAEYPAHIPTARLLLSQFLEKHPSPEALLQGILRAHGFWDANGRLARMAYYIQSQREHTAKNFQFSPTHMQNLNKEAQSYFLF